MAGKASQQKILDIFQQYDSDGDGGISMDELHSVLKVLGNFNNAEIKTVFGRIDKNKDGTIQYQEFVDWIFGGSKKQDVRAKAALVADDSSKLQNLFYSFCGSGHIDMDGKSFAKLCKDAQLLDNSFTATEVDIIFAKAVKKGQRRIDFDAFLVALKLAAEKKGLDEEIVKRSVEGCRGPKLQATQAEAVRFHDDKSTYTGTHQGKADLSSGLAETTASAASASAPPAVGAPAAAGSVKAKAAAAEPSQASEGLLAAFRGFCGSSQDLDGKGFVKVCKDCGLVDKNFSATDADLIFAKVVVKGTRRMSFDRFEDALEQVAARKGMDASRVQEAVRLSGGPVLNCTKAETVRLHDDKSTYSGTHGKGGPE